MQNVKTILWKYCKDLKALNIEHEQHKLDRLLQ